MPPELGPDVPGGITYDHDPHLNVEIWFQELGEEKEKASSNSGGAERLPFEF
jgi:hypothetical protein